MSFYVPCSCGCDDVVHFQAAHGTLYVSFLRSEFYSQQSPIRGAIKERLKYAFLKKSDIREILLNRDMLISLKKYLKKVVCTEPDSSANVGTIHPEHAYGDINALVLTGNISAGEVLTGGFHQMFDLVLNDQERLALIEQIDAVLAAPIEDEPCDA